MFEEKSEAPPQPGFTCSHILQMFISERNKQLRTEIGSRGYLVSSRKADHFPAATMTLGCAEQYIPDFVAMGHVDEIVVKNLFDWLYTSCNDIPLTDRMLMPADEWAGYLNNLLAEHNGDSTFRVIVINTEQYMYGVGVVAKRFYGNHWDSTRVLQVLYPMGERFPDDPEYMQHEHAQPILPTEPFALKRRTSPSTQWGTIIPYIHEMN